MQPFDYRIAVQDPLQMALAGYQQGQQFQNQRVQAERETQLYDMEMQKYQANQAKLQQEQARAKQFQANTADLFERVDSGMLEPGYIDRWLAENPEIGEVTAQALQNMNEAQKNEVIKQEVRLLSALSNETGPPSDDSFVARILTERKAAAEAAGRTQEADSAEANLMLYKSNPVALKTTLMAQLGAGAPDIWKQIESQFVQEPEYVEVETADGIFEYIRGRPETMTYLGPRREEAITPYQAEQLRLDRAKLDFEMQKDANATPERNTEKDQNGVLRYIDTGEPVFPDVETAPEAAKPLIGSEAMARVTAGLPNAKQAVEDLDRLVFRSKGTFLTAEGYDPASDLGAAAIEAIPDFGLFKGVARTVGGEDYQLFKDSYGSFEAAMLPIISGAAITESEGLRQMRALEIKPGDSEQTKKRKITGMKAMVSGVEKAARGDTAGFLKMLDQAGTISGAGPVNRGGSNDEDAETEALVNQYLRGQ
jgi:hypothetical protein